MRTLEKGSDKIATICQTLRKDALEPAQKESEALLHHAREKSEAILHEARQEAERIVAEKRAEMQKEKASFLSSLAQASNQTIATLKQEIEQKLFQQTLSQVIQKGSSSPVVVAELIKAIIAALKKEGLAANLQAIVPKQVSKESVNQELGGDILETLTKGSVEIGTISGGAQVRLEGKRMMLDISDQALKELLSQYVRKDFRSLLFNK